MANFMNNANAKHRTQREALESKYNSSISNLLIVIGFTLINVVLLITNGNTYFLFSAFIPYFLADYGMYFCGMYPEEYYYDVPDMEFADKSLLAVTLAIAAVIMLLYLLCWFLAKKKKVGWLIFALVLFAVDTVAMFALAGLDSDSVFDILIHAWVIFYLVNGIVVYFKIKKLPEETKESTVEGDEENVGSEVIENSPVLRMADPEVKARVFLETEAHGYRIVYRRVKRTNELVVNGRVYDEYVALAESAHSLEALVDGHRIEARFDGVGNVFIFFDGQRLAKKIRLY